MRIRMKTVAAGPSGVLHVGQEVDLPDAQAQAFVAGGYAELVVQAQPKKSAAEGDSAEREATTIEPPEDATRRHGVRRPRGR